MKLSEENKEWMLKNVHCGKRFRGYDAALDYEVIEEKLLEMQQRIDELEKENAELRSHNSHLIRLVENCIRDLPKVNASQVYIDALISDLNEPKQSLAQHDKGVALKTIDDACQYVTAKFPNGFLHSMAEFKKKHLKQK